MNQCTYTNGVVNDSPMTLDRLMDTEYLQQLTANDSRHATEPIELTRQQYMQLLRDPSVLKLSPINDAWPTCFAGVRVYVKE